MACFHSLNSKPMWHLLSPYKIYAIYIVSLRDDNLARPDQLYVGLDTGLIKN